jgi:hypothetical protein
MQRVLEHRTTRTKAVLPSVTNRYCSRQTRAGIISVGGTVSERQLQDFLAAIEEVKRTNAETAEQARRFLQDEGVYSPSGELTDPYR